MHIKAIASTAILAATFALAGPAFAQTMIGNQQVTEADMERVKNYCEDLKLKDEGAVATADDATKTEEAVETAAVGAVDTDQITLENCVEAGFIEK